MSNFEGSHFVVVDDDDATREKIIQNLRDLGFTGTIYQAVNGQEAVILLNDLASTGAQVDLVICDIVMPLKNGVEALEEVRGSGHSLSKVPFLMLTSQSDRSLVVACVKLGVSQYLIKPWDNKSLLGKIVEALKK